MKHHLRSINLSILCMLAASYLLIGGCGKSDTSNETEQPKGRTLDFEREVHFLSSASDDTLATIEVSIADEDNERNTGLMDVQNLPPYKGMFFIFPKEKPRSFWMANTPLSLDIIFVNRDYEIVRIHRNTQPFAEQRYTSDRPAKYVVEVNGGFSTSHDITAGTRIAID